MPSGETIVCGVDDSQEARLALRAAGALAARLDARLVVVHGAADPAVPGVSAVPGGVERVAAEEEERARELVDGMLEELGIRGAEVRVTFRGASGAALASFAADEGAGLVVVGARGRGAIASAVLGSTSTAVVANATCPVLVVPGDEGALGLFSQ